MRLIKGIITPQRSSRRSTRARNARECDETRRLRRDSHDATCKSTLISYAQHLDEALYIAVYRTYPRGVDRRWRLLPHAQHTCQHSSVMYMSRETRRAERTAPKVDHGAERCFHGQKLHQDDLLRSNHLHHSIKRIFIDYYATFHSWKRPSGEENCRRRHHGLSR